MNQLKLPYNLQFFAEGDSQDKGQQEPGAGIDLDPQHSGGTGQQAGTAIDYAKIQQMLEGTLSAKENVALKEYFKQQGLSQQEVEQAILSFKAEKAKNQPDVNAIQTQLTKEQQAVQQKTVENAAILAAVGLGMDAKTIPYMLKMADLSNALGEDGKVNEETIKNALNKVLEDVPALKPSTEQSKGFLQVGAQGGATGQQANANDALKAAFGLT